jgi:hypothetical protein
MAISKAIENVNMKKSLVVSSASSVLFFSAFVGFYLIALCSLALGKGKAVHGD